MKQLTTTLALSFLGIGVWQLSYRLSPDALAMAIGLTFGLLVCVGLLLLVVVSQRHEPVRRDEDAPPVVYVYNDNRQLLIALPTQYPQWPQAPQGMPLIADRQREIQQRAEWQTYEHNGFLPAGHSGMRD